MANFILKSNIGDIRSATAKQLACINDQRGAESLRIATDIKSLTARRVQTSGQDSKGNRFPDYTSRYKKTRAKDGFQVSFPDYTRTGQMWRTILPEITSQDEQSTTVEIAARNALSEKKLEGLARRGPNPLIPNQKELEIAVKANEIRVLKCLNEI